MIKIRKSPTADTRTCDASKVGKQELINATIMHMKDVKNVLWEIIGMLGDRANKHDHTKLSRINDFHRDFINGFKTTEWWQHHKETERHHLSFPGALTESPTGITLIDVLENMVDGIVAGMARSGKYIPQPIGAAELQLAYKNTVNMILAKIEVEDGLENEKHNKP